MTIHELKERLRQEGCNESYYAIGRRYAFEGHLLVLKDAMWQVCYSERGKDASPMFSSPSEEAACAFFFDVVMRIRHDHLLGFFKDEASMLRLKAALNHVGIQTLTDRIVYKYDEVRYRVFVIGKDIFSARDYLSKAYKDKDYKDYETLPLEHFP